jgi:hypothetical protein
MADSRSVTLHDKSSPAPSLDDEKRAPSTADDKETGLETSAERSVATSVNEKTGSAHGSAAEKDDAVEAAKNELRKIQTSEEGVEYPKGAKLGLITLALCLSVFLMALVCSDWSPSLGNLALIKGIGQHHHCYCYPENYRRVQQFGRCWLVWKW